MALKFCFLNMHRKVNVLDVKNKSRSQQPNKVSMLLVRAKCPCLTFVSLFCCCCCREEENDDDFVRCQPYKNIAVSVEKFNPPIFSTSKSFVIRHKYIAIRLPLHSCHQPHVTSQYLECRGVPNVLGL